MPKTRKNRQGAKNHRKNHRKNGGGYLTDAQFFNPDHLPPTTVFPAPSTAPTSTETRPVLLATVGPMLTGGKRRTMNGGGTLTDAQYLNPDNLAPASLYAAPSGAPTSTEIRPILLATNVPALTGGKRGKRNNTRRLQGGFVPSVMGSFVANAEAAIVPAALYLVYHTMVPKNVSKTVGGLVKKFTRRFRK